MTSASRTSSGAAALPPELLNAVRDRSRVSTRLLDRVARAADASHYLLTPRAVVTALDATEVAALLRAAAGSRSPITFRSGGTSLSGQASSEGVLVDVRQGFRRIDVLDDGRRVRVQPGATVRQVNARLARYGTRLGPDPASEAACTIGGVVANNSSGMACGIVENTYRTLESMVAVLPSGTIVDTGAPDADVRLRVLEPALVAGLERLQRRVREHPGSVETIRRQFSMKNTMGYGVNAFLDFESPAELLAHLLIGSEGTLAFVAQATFRTVPLKPLAATALAVFPSLDAATSVLPELVASGAATLELMDATSLRVGQSMPGVPDAMLGFDVGDHAALLVEYQDAEAEALARRVAAGGDVLADVELVRPARFVRDAAERAAAWTFRKGLYASVAGARPSGTTALLEDIVVPVSTLASACADLQTLFERYRYRDSVIFGHARDGNIHFMLTDRFEGEEATARYLAFTDEMVALVLGRGGNLKAEHGTGRAMAPYLRHQYGAELADVMRELKRLFDPAGVLNPGVIIDDDPEGHLRGLQQSTRIEPEVDRCVECGYCEPVCPSRDLTLTPRQRIVVRRAITRAREAGDEAAVAELERDYDYEGVQTCAVDGMCQLACPVRINTGDLVKRLRRNDSGPVAERAWSAVASQWGAATRGGAAALTVADRLPASLVRGASTVARAALDPDVVPEYTADLPGGGSRRRRFEGVVGDPEAAPIAVYLPACVSSMFGPGGGVSDAVVALLARAGRSVLVPKGIEGLCCGTPWSSKGRERGYARMRERTRAAVAAVTLDGSLPVVTDASSCSEGLRELLEESGATVEDVTVFAARELLPRLAVAPERRLETLVLHPTCSSRRLGIDAQIEQIAAAVAATPVVPLDWACCGFAGDRGMLHPELTAAATAPEAAEVVGMDADAHASCNRTCELGMTRATGTPYRHVLELLEEATRPVP